MTEHPFEVLRRAALEECTALEEIASAASVVASSLKATEPAEVTFAPGNGTRYPYLFVPAIGTNRWTTAREGLESASAGDARDEGVVWVIKLGSGSRAYPIKLMGRQEPPSLDYIAEKWFDGNTGFDAVILGELLREIGRNTG